MLMYIILSVITAICISYVFKFRTKNVKRLGIYSQQSSLWYYPRWLLCLIQVKLAQINRVNRINNFDPQATDYATFGVVPTPSEEKMEKPQTLITDRHEDGILIWGGSEDGHFLVAKVVRLSRRRVCVSLVIRDEENQLYSLPNHPDTNLTNAGEQNSWKGGGLLVECLNPMRLWRIKFNGILRKGVRDEYITDILEDDDECQDSYIHVKLSFLWTSLNAPIDVWKQSSARILADALLRETTPAVNLFEEIDRDGYDQWGVLHGEVTLAPNETQVWYLRGARQHRWGMSDSATNLHRSVNFFSFFTNGDYTWLEAFSYKAGISHCLMGYTVTAAGKYIPICQTNLELSELAEDRKMPKSILLKFKAGRQWYDWWHKLEIGLKVKTGDPWTLEHQICPTVSACGKEDGYGLVIFTNRFSGLCPVPERQKLPIFSFDEIDLNSLMNLALVIDLNDDLCLNEKLSGGKGMSLSALITIKSNIKKAQFNVPKGIIVTANSWKMELQENQELLSGITYLEKAVASTHVSRIKEACKRLEQQIKSIRICDKIVNDLREKLELNFSELLQETSFAVRSSACGEDSTEASSAGQNATYLGCKWRNGNLNSAASVLDALRHCWASQFSFQSLEYRRQRGQPVNNLMAVVIQEMVDADAAGVLFTLHPTTGDPSKMFITANFGLGESVVSSYTEPDTFIVKRSWRNKFAIENVILGKKDKQIILNEDEGTKELSFAEGEKLSACLTDNQVIQLCKVCALVQESFGSPRDIEFAFSNNVIYLLQSRPITSQNDWTDYEIIHELDTAVSSDEEIFTRANTGEVFPECTSPLSISLVAKLLDLGIQRDFVQREWPTYKYDPSTGRIVASTHSQVILNVGETCFRGNEDHITMVNHAVDLAVFGHLVSDKLHPWALKKYGVMSIFAKIIRMGYAFYDLFINGRRIQKCLPIYSNYDIDRKRISSANVLYKEICRRIPEMSKICETHCHTSSSSTMAQCIAMVTLAEKKKEITAEMIQDMARLLACSSSSESSEVPTALKKLAQVIADHEEKDEFLSMSPEEGSIWLESDPRIVGKEFKRFMERHGHRCIKEFDMLTQPWGSAPESLVGTLQMLVSNPIAMAESKDSPQVQDVLESLICPITHSTKRALTFILKLCIKAVNDREKTKSMLIKTLNAFRKSYRTLGALMVSECRLPDAELIFFLHHREIGVLLETMSPVLIQKAAKRRRLMPLLEELHFKEIIIGIPKPVSLNAPLNTTEPFLQGTPVCQGRAKGAARVVTNLKDASNIMNGEILVTYSTDVGWTPYFPVLSAVVTEIGGLISHGAVVAREYGIPCIVGVTDVTKLMKSGEIIIVDGGKGIIEREF